MQLFANLLQADGTAAMSDAETAQTLASVKDVGSISADRRNAVALCMQKGLVQGFSDGMIKPQGTFTRCLLYTSAGRGGSPRPAVVRINSHKREHGCSPYSQPYIYLS